MPKPPVIQNLNPEDFQFVLQNNSIPHVIFKGKEIAIFSINYRWQTSTEKSIGAEELMMSGYCEDDPHNLKSFCINFKTGKVTQVSITKLLSQ